jgi:predicted Zn-dependent peptidase
MKKPILKTLPNGVRVLMIPQVGALTATALVLVGTGSLYESKAENGLSHFLEHMMFKGTERFPTTKDIVENFERIGAISNAFTSNEYTGYYAKGGPHNISTFLDILSDIYCNSIFPEAEIDKERGVIIEEINMYEDMPQQKVAETLLSLMYGDQPAGWPIAGSKENVAQFTRPDFLLYKQKHYHADNTLIVVSGDIDTALVYKEVKQRFGGLSSSHSIKKQKTRITDDGLKLAIVHKPFEQAHIALGFYGIPFTHPDARIASLLATILGRGLSSRLSQRLREELGVAYYVGAGNETYGQYGLFEITAGIDKRRINEIFTHIADILTNLKEVLISDSELHKAVEFTLGMHRLGLESSDDLAGFYATQVMMGDMIKTPTDLERVYRAITAQDLRRVARKLFKASGLSIAVIGPYETQDIDTSPFLAL